MAYKYRHLAGRLALAVKLRHYREREAQAVKLHRAEAVAEAEAVAVPPDALRSVDR